MTEPTAGVMTNDDQSPFAGVPDDEQPAWWRAAMAFVAGLADIPWLQPDGEPDADWRLFSTRTEARDTANDAAWDAAHDAAWESAREAAMGSAREAAMGSAHDAAWESAREEARTAAWDAARDVAYDVASDAALDAALMAIMLVCDGLPVEARHVEHARARMRVWEKGYGLVGDIDGVLYVYEGLA